MTRGLVGSCSIHALSTGRHNYFSGSRPISAHVREVRAAIWETDQELRYLGRTIIQQRSKLIKFIDVTLGTGSSWLTCLLHLLNS